VTATISPRKGKLSKSLLSVLQEYYRKINPDYLDAKLKIWREDPAVNFHLIKKGEENIGWIIYNAGKSSIEEILLRKKWRGNGLEAFAIDNLIKQENLLAAELCRDDDLKYNWLVAYGFRPTSVTDLGGVTGIKMDLSTSVLMRKLDELRVNRAYHEREQVAIERIPSSQTDAEIKAGLTHLLDKLGGLDQYIKPGQTVVIKPNVVSDHGLKDGIYKGGIVTDVRLVKAMAELLLPIAGKIIIAEGSSINRSETSKMFRHYGFDQIPALDPEKVSLVDLNKDKTVEKIVPGGKRMLSRRIPVTLDQADVIISVPVMKIHFAAVVSLSVKNLQGTVPPLEKYMSHYFGLWQNLVNINHLVRPDLIIIDGLTGQEGFGPLSGTPKQMDLLIGGTNPVAVDATAMRIMGIEPIDSPPVRLAYLQGFGPLEENMINIIGPSVDEVKSEFEQPVFNLSSGMDISINEGNACQGCRAYFHFTVSKLRKPDPQDKSRQIIDRPMAKKVNIYLGPDNDGDISLDETNIFIGLCQQHNADQGLHLPGCPPHTEVLIDGIYSLFPDVEKAKYADKSEEATLGEMLQEIMRMNKVV